MLVAQIKTENNSFELKNEITHILYLVYQHNEITKALYGNVIKLL